MIQRTLIAALVLAAVIGLPSAARAEAPAVAVVDVVRLITESKAGTGLEKQIKERKESLQKEFSGKEAELKKLETTLMAERDKLSAEELEKKSRAFQEKVMEARKLFQKRSGSLEKGLADAQLQLDKAIIESTTAVAEEKKFDIVLKKEGTILFAKSLDITADVLKKLDTKLSSITLKSE